MVKLFDNSSESTQLVTPIKAYLRSAKLIKIATGYFYLGGYEEIKDHIPDQLTEGSFKIIMGDETDTITVNELKKGFTYKQKIVEDTLKDLASITDYDDKRAIEFIANVQNLYDLIAKGIIDFRIFTKGKFHVKLYLFISNPDELKRKRDEIIGNSGIALLG